MKVASTMCLISIMIFGMIPICDASSYKVRVPHTIEFMCEEGTGGYTGYWGLKVVWGPYPDAAGYQVISHHGAYGGGLVAGNVHEWSIGGGSPVAPGGCPAIEASVNPAWYQNIYEVWGTFPEGGNLELHKTDNIYGAAHPGDEVRYFLIYKNTGKYPLLDCIVEETWPDYMEFVAGGSSTGPNTVIWNFGTLYPGQWVQVELVLRISEDLPQSITEIYNVAVAHPAPSPSPAPGGTPGSGISTVSGYAVSHCDALRCNFVTGDTDWIDRPDFSSYQDLVPYDVVRGNDDVLLNSGFTSFNHTVATGTLLLYQGGFHLTNCPDLPDQVLSEIILDTPASIEHAVSGIMSPDDHVRVLGQFLTVEIHEGRYTLSDDAASEFVEVESGGITVVDPLGDRHDLTSGDTFTWPPLIGPKNGSNGPTLTGTSPDPFGSVEVGHIAIQYEFDEAVSSIGNASSFAIGETSGVWHGSGTLTDLASYVSISWNAENTIMTLTVNSTYPWFGMDLAAGMTLITGLHLVDVTGPSGTTPEIYQTIPIFVTSTTSSLGWVSCEYEHFSFITQGNDLLSPGASWHVQQLPSLPGAVPAGMYQASPAFEFQFDGTVLDHYWLQLRPGTPWGLPQGNAGGGLYVWSGAEWVMQREGFGLEWTWSNPLTDPHQIIVLLSVCERPEAPGIVSIVPNAGSGPVSPDSAIVIQVAARSGIREHTADIRINGQRTLSFDPATGQLQGWIVEENDGVTTFTYTPETEWQDGQIVFVSYYLAARFGLISTEGSFAFQVVCSDPTDGDGDGMPDKWETANGTNPSGFDRDADPDGDSHANITEYTHCSSPSSSISLPAFPRIDIVANQEAYYASDEMLVKARVTSGPVSLPVDLYVALELYGGFYFWPAFSTDVVPISFTMPSGIDVSFDLFSYTWDTIPAAMTLTWYGVFVEPQSMFLYSLDSLSMILAL